MTLITFKEDTLTSSKLSNILFLDAEMCSLEADKEDNAIPEKVAFTIKIVINPIQYKLFLA